MLEKGWLGGGNIARNTTVIRSNYLWDESAAIYEHSLKLWEGLAAELDYDLLFCQRGVLNLAHSLQDVRDVGAARAANRLNGIDAEWLDPDEVAERLPDPQRLADGALPGARRDASSRAAGSRGTRTSPGATRGRADALGVDLVQGCEVTGIEVRGGRAVAVETTLGPDRAPAGSGSSPPAIRPSWPRWPGIELPIQSHPLQALVSELYEPVLDTVVMSNAVHVYVSQAHKGELVMGAGIDPYVSYAQRGCST